MPEPDKFKHEIFENCHSKNEAINRFIESKGADLAERIIEVRPLMFEQTAGGPRDWEDLSGNGNHAIANGPRDYTDRVYPLFCLGVAAEIKQSEAHGEMVDPEAAAWAHGWEFIPHEEDAH